MIDAHRLDELFKDCFFRVGEATEPRIEVSGIMNRFGFHPGRLESYREEVKAMLMQLPDDFRRSKGGGMSFLQACMTRRGEQWGEHRNMEQLFSLGMGLGLVEECLPRPAWKHLPGGMPYYAVLDQAS